MHNKQESIYTMRMRWPKDIFHNTTEKGINVLTKLRTNK